VSISERRSHPAHAARRIGLTASPIVTAAAAAFFLWWNHTVDIAGNRSSPPALVGVQDAAGRAGSVRVISARHSIGAAPIDRPQ
jgi:hypothetical protein